MMRRDGNRSHNHTHNPIIVRSDHNTTSQLGGRTWIKIPGLVKGQRIAILLNTTVEPTATLRIIIKDDDRIEVNYTVDMKEKRIAVLKLLASTKAIGKSGSIPMASIMVKDWAHFFARHPIH